MTDTNFVVSKKETMDKRDLARLVDYYRMRVEAFEKERIEWLERLEGLRLTQEEQHRMEWELRRRTDEIVELQNALSESNISLNSERKQIIHLTSELENGKLRTKEDRRRLVQLLQLAEPIEQTIKLYYDRRPEKLEKYASSDIYGSNSQSSMYYDPDSIALNKSLRASTGKQSLYSSNANKRTSYSSKKIPRVASKCSNCTKSKKCNKCANMTNGLFSPKLEYRIAPSDEKQHIVRTILMPNETTSVTLNDENEYLRKQLFEMKNMYESQISRMEEDRRLREEEMRLRDVNFREKIEDLTKKNQKLERLNYELTKDHMQLKYDSSTNEKKLYEELEMAKLQNEALSVSIKELSNRTNVDKELNKNDYERKTREITNVMRSQVRNHEENINIIKEQYKQIQKIYTSRVKELETKLKSLSDKYRTLENRRTSEIEGYINEVNLMRKRLKSYEEYVGKLRRMNSYEGGNDFIEDTHNFLVDVKKTKEELENCVRKLKDENTYSNNNSQNQSESNHYSQMNDEEGEEMEEGDERSANRSEERSNIAMEDL